MSHFIDRMLFLWLFLTKSSLQYFHSKLLFLLETLLTITPLLFLLPCQCLLLSLYQICYLGPLYSFVQILYPKIKTPSLFLLISLSFIPVTLPYFEMIQHKALFVGGKVKLFTHCSLLSHHLVLKPGQSLGQGKWALPVFSYEMCFRQRKAQSTF